MQRRALIVSTLLASVIVTGSLPALAANPSLTLTPNHGTATQTFSARVTYTITHGKCPGSASFTWDGVSLGSASFVGSHTCTATKSGLKPLSGHSAAGSHLVKGTFVYKQSTHSTSSIFTVTAPKPSPSPTPKPTPTPTKTATPKPKPSPSASAKASASASATPTASASVSPSPSPSAPASPSASSGVAAPPPSVSPGSSLNVPTEALVHHNGDAVFWILIAILGTIVLGPGIWFVLSRGEGADAEDTLPTDSGPPSSSSGP